VSPSDTLVIEIAYLNQVGGSGLLFRAAAVGTSTLRIAVQPAHHEEHRYGNDDEHQYLFPHTLKLLTESQEFSALVDNETPSPRQGTCVCQLISDFLDRSSLPGKDRHCRHTGHIQKYEDQERICYKF